MWDDLSNYTSYYDFDWRAQSIYEGWLKLHGEWIEKRTKWLRHLRAVINPLSNTLSLIFPMKSEPRWKMGRWKAKT